MSKIKMYRFCHRTVLAFGVRPTFAEHFVATSLLIHLWCVCVCTLAYRAHLCQSNKNKCVQMSCIMRGASNTIYVTRAYREQLSQKQILRMLSTARMRLVNQNNKINFQWILFWHVGGSAGPARRIEHIFDHILIHSHAPPHSTIPHVNRNWFIGRDCQMDSILVAGSQNHKTSAPTNSIRYLRKYSRVHDKPKHIN